MIKLNNKYEMDSGLGGIFTVRVLDYSEETKRYRVVNITNKDFYGSMYFVREGDLREVH